MTYHNPTYTPACPGQTAHHRGSDGKHTHSILLKSAAAVLLLLLLCSVFCGAAAADSSVLPTSGVLSSTTYTLTGDVQLTGELKVPSGIIATIDLNNHIITAASGNRVITVEGNLNLTDTSDVKTGKITGGSAAYSGGGVYVASGGTFTMNGGCITGNTAVHGHGGGVYVANGGTFTMNGGSIIENTAMNDGGGGVYVGFYGTFTMSGGNITGNSAEKGSGVYVDDDGTFTMSGGSIAGNIAENGGGGVYVDDDGTFTMSGGSITKNSAEGDKISGGGVYVYNGKFTMSGGNITDNSANYNGGGVYLDEDEFTMSGGNITNNNAKNGGGVYVDDGTFTMSGGNIMDNHASNLGGGVRVHSHGRFEITGGNITENSASSNGGGVQLAGKVAMSGGNITKNSAEKGGGVRISGGDFTMSGGNITENSANSNGGGVYFSTGTFSVNGTPLINNNTLDDKTTANNVYLASHKITVTAKLTGANIHITNSPTGLFGEGGEGYTITQDDAKCFHLDSGLDAMIKDGKLYWTVAKIVNGGTTTFYETVHDAVAAALSGQTITMLGDSIEDTLVVNKEIILDLAGHVLSNTGGHSVIEIESNGNLTMMDSSSVTHCFEVQTDLKLREFFDDSISDTQKEDDDSCIENTNAQKEGAKTLIENIDTSDFMAGNSIEATGGVITGGGGELGGGVLVMRGGKFTMTGGNIVGNSAAFEGGGVWVSAGSFTMTGGNIIGNSAGYNGGGVYNCGTFDMQGGNIVKNSAKKGGGVYAWSCTFNVRGTPLIKYNTKTDADAVNPDGSKKFTFASADNVYLAYGQKITVTDALTGGSIYINDPVSDEAVFAQAGAGYTITENDAAYFHPDFGFVKAKVDGNILKWVMITDKQLSSTASEDKIAKFGNNNITTVKEEGSSKVSLVRLESVSGVTGTVTFTANLNSDAPEIPAQAGVNRVVVSVFGIEAAPAASGTKASFKMTLELVNPADKENVVFWHFKDERWEKLRSSIVAEINERITYEIETDSFSPFAITIESEIPHSSTSSRDYGASVWLTATAEPTPTPAAEQPTQAQPTASPVDQPQQQASTPAPAAGIIAGLGAALVFGLRRK